jgi:hypothetical protein
MRILVTGSRNWPDKEIIANALIDLTNWFPIIWEDVVIVHGDCPTGADAMAQEFAEQHGIRTERHPADWKRYGKFAGPKRNQEMVDLGADICLAFILPGSRGTKHCMGAAEKAGIPVWVFDESTAV